MLPSRCITASHAHAGWVFALILLPGFAFASNQLLTLEQATRLAVARAPMLRARDAQAVAEEQEAAGAGALPDPVLTVGIDNLPVTGADAFDPSADFMTMKKVGVRQDIPAPAKREARINLATRRIDEAQAQTIAEALAVRRSVAEAWVDVWAAQRELQELQALHAQAGLAATIAKARVTGGGSVSEALATQAAAFEVDNRIEAARATQQSAQADLARWLGDELVDVSSNSPDFGSLPFSEQSLIAAVDRFGASLPASAHIETAAAAIDVARAEKHSDWSVAAYYGQRSGMRSDMLTVEVGIGLPLFTHNRQDRGVAAREADYQAALAEREDQRRQQIAQVRSAIARWEGLKRQVALHETSLLPLANDRSSTALAAYRAGGDVRAWLDAQRDELALHLSHAEHQGDLGRAWVALAFLLPTEQQP